MADYWALDTNDALATDLAIGCMFDQPNLEDQVLNFTSPITLTTEGSPTRPTVNGKLAYRPATDKITTNSAITFGGQWLTALSRSEVGPCAYMYNFMMEDASIAPASRIGTLTLGLESGTKGLYGFLPSDNVLRSVYGRFNTSTNYVDNGVTDNVYHRVIGTTEGPPSNYTFTIYFDGGAGAGTIAQFINEDDIAEMGRIMNGTYGVSLDGIITDFFWWSRSLTSQEVSDLFADPYRFLIPPDTGAAATQNAIFMGFDF